MTNWPEIVFTTVFLAQILLISWYVPAKILKRMDYVMTHYPRSEYPKLYPRSEEFYRLGQMLFRNANRIIFLLGFAFLYLALTTGRETIPDVIPGGYFILQFVPLMAMELWECNNFKLMRQSNTSTKRTAELRRRDLFRYVSPWLVVSAALAFVMAISAELFMPGQVFEWDKVIVLTLGCGFLMGIAAFNLYGRKLNPHQSAGERARFISIAVHSMFYLVIAICAYFTFKSVEDALDLQNIDAISMSVYMQLVAFLSIGVVLRSTDPEDIDFSVYRADPTST
ncbi:MAG: hypothetical protein R3217_07445 [Gammaproteobacteria bacterium]|nr:hypothetical protein [Gammaproteobacteria bacterium]